MNIAYLTQSYPPMVSGAALTAEGLANEMAARGHKVLVIAASEREHGYMTIERNLTLLRLRSVHNPQRVGQRFMLFPRGEILRSLRAFQPEIVHCHDPLQIGTIGLEHARCANIPVLLSIHQLPWFVSAYLPKSIGIRRGAERILWGYARWLLRQFTALITPTQTIAEIIQRKTGIQPQTIGYGVDLRMFHPCRSPDEEIDMRTRLDLPLDAPVILHVGRLDTDKGVERAIRASEKSLHGTNAHLLVVGDGRQKPVLMQLCKDLRIASRCHFTGYISIKQGLPAIYRLASLFVTASEIETQGIVLLEAAASGLPIVAVRATCIPETVRDGFNGYLAEPGNLYGLSHAMTTLLAQPKKATEMGKAGCLVAKGFDIQNTLDKYEQLYSNLILLEKVHRKKTPIPSYWKRARD